MHGYSVELLPSGFVRVDAPSGLVSLFEIRADGSVRRHSGQGSVPASVVSEVERAWL